MSQTIPATFPIKAEHYDLLRATAERYGGVGACDAFENSTSKPWCLHGVAVVAGLETYKNIYPANEFEVNTIGLPSWQVIDDRMTAAFGVSCHLKRVPFDQAAKAIGLVQVE